MFFRRLLLVLMLVGLVVLSIVAVSHAQDEAEEETVLFIGTVTGFPDEFVGLAIDGEDITLYICDGQADKGTISIAQWFVGKVTDNLIDITAANGNRVEVSLDDELTASGKFTFGDGSTKEFALHLARDTAALFRSEFAFGEEEFVGGWLILEDGSVRGGVFKKGTEELVPASFNGFQSKIDLVTAAR